MTATPQLVVALDLPEKDAALTLAARLRGIVPWVKAGMELFTLCGPSVLSALKDRIPCAAQVGYVEAKREDCSIVVKP